MITSTDLKNHTDLFSISQSRLYLNQLIRFILDSPPEKDALLKLAEDPSFITLCEMNHACQTIQTGVHSLLSQDNSSLQLAGEEYNRLFVGPNVLPVPLWESVYLSREHIMFEEQTLQVRECYRQHGLNFVRGTNEPDDHIVIELEFLSFLIEQTIFSPILEMKQKYLDDQLSFLNDHLLKWGPQFCELLTKTTQFDLYRGVALLLDEYLALEKDLVKYTKEALHNE